MTVELHGLWTVLNASIRPHEINILCTIPAEPGKEETTFFIIRQEVASRSGAEDAISGQVLNWAYVFLGGLADLTIKV
ncbi:hypothetical protein ACH5RR_001513 [Cinchona calisaya]|uniref:Uncharacterized protein n=1 Tax=Cinchona calisaya TaxID=153742 RepID=A0ABD3B3L1_9GENT